MSLEQYSVSAARSVVHRTIEIPVDWLDFVTQLEHRLNRYNPTTLTAATNMTEFETAVVEMNKGEPFSIFANYDHGRVLNLLGQHANVKQYVIGNPVFASTMTRLDTRTAQSLPIANLVWERKEGWTTIEFEVAASMCGALSEGNNDVVEAAVKVDELREGLFARIFEDVKAGTKADNDL